MKRFLTKIYTKAGIFKETIREDEILSDVNFDYQKNWWIWQITLKLNRDYSNIDIVESDFIKIYLFDENFINWKLIYTWIIEEINRNYNELENSIDLIARWLSSLLTRIYYKDWWNYTFSKTDTVSNIIKSIINYANTQYNWFNISWIVDTVWNITIDFDYNDCLNAINKVVELTDLFYYIWSDWIVYFNTTPTTHKLTAQKHIQSIDINEDWSEIINKVIVKYNWWTTSWENSSSISQYWLLEKVYTKTDLWLAEATSFINEELAKNQLKQKTSIEVNSQYILENLKPWDTIKINNLNYSINTTIEKISYKTDIATIYLDRYDSIWLILNK